MLSEGDAESDGVNDGEPDDDGVKDGDGVLERVAVGDGRIHVVGERLATDQGAAPGRQRTRASGHEHPDTLGTALDSLVFDR